MRFITEQDIRTTFIQTPFEVYPLPADTRLTPEARQFLVDRKITIINGDTKKLPKTVVVKNQEKPDLELTSSLFLLAVSLMVEADPVLAEKLSQLYQRMQEASSLKAEPEVVEELEDLEITMFHVLLPHGKELAVLNLLQTQLNQMLASEPKDPTHKPMYSEFRRIRCELICIMKKILGGDVS
ncbi:hypothetical protein [Enterococcus sp.]|uniref:hypothetical protein n=1 Tax=Enterococcus sp. TaxID=35783 RepID=UPI00290A0B23|nr:hypothetical protein [Enterococcus sp.]MDU5335344.1 hypothetical protein [Enterococcus sp.]